MFLGDVKFGCVGVVYYFEGVWFYTQDFLLVGGRADDLGGYVVVDDEHG